MIINIVKDDLFNIKCDAIVSPTDEHFSASGGIDKKIRSLGGEAMKENLQNQLQKYKQDKAAIGACYVTPAENCNASFVIHAVVPKYHKDKKEESFELLFKLCQNIIFESKSAMRHIAMPAIGCGNGGYPLYQEWFLTANASETATTIISGLMYAAARARIVPETITIVCSDEATFSAFKNTQKYITGAKLSIRDRIRGSLLGGAIGDAYGYPIEFCTGKEVKIKEYELDEESKKAVVSDDTQMTLFTACGLLFAYTRSCTHGVGGNPINFTKFAYLDWLETQGVKAENHPCVSWIKTIKELNVRRAPGNTCLSVLINGTGTVKNPVNNSKGCGAVMRVAPIALYGAGSNVFDKDSVAIICAETSALTHGHPLGWLSSVALGNIIYDLMLGFSIHFAVEETIRYLKKKYKEYPETARMTELLESARSLAYNSYQTSSYDLLVEMDVIEQLGEGWVGEEALAVGLYAVMACIGSGFDRCMFNAACHKGDSDSTASIAGQIWGAAFGIESIDKKKWLTNLELKDVITEIADDMTDNCKIHDWGFYNDPDWAQKYLSGDISEGKKKYYSFSYGTFDSKLKEDKVIICHKADQTYKVIAEDGKIYHVGNTEAAVSTPSYSPFKSPVDVISEGNKILYKNSIGWIRRKENVLEAYYLGIKFDLIKDADENFQIISQVGVIPWIGDIKYSKGGNDNIYEIKVLNVYARIIPAIKLILAENL